MAILRRDDTVQTAMGQAVAGAQVFYLTQPANTSTLTPLATVYSDTSGTPAANPQITDGFGHSVAYLDNSQPYTIVWVSPLIGKIIYTDQVVGQSVGPITVTKGVPSGVIDGTNTVFTLPATPTIALFLQLNSALLIPGVGYTVDGNVVTLTQAPQNATQSPPNGDYLYATVLS